MLSTSGSNSYKIHKILFPSVQLQLSACREDQFTCRNGKCVGVEKRCDNVEVLFRKKKLLQF